MKSKINKLLEDSKLLNEFKNALKFFFSWKYWVASLIVIAINGGIVGIVSVMWFFSGGIVTLNSFFIGWTSAIFSCVIWVMLIQWSKRKHGED